MSEKYIGIFDSGIGGLTVVKAISEMMKNENIIYFGDTKNMPYGDKSKEEIIKLVKEDVKFISSFNLKAIVIACNTADSVARKIIESEYDFPVYGVVEPASRKAALLTKNNKVGVIATKATVESGSYVEAIHSVNPDIEVYTNACPLLALLVEQGKFTSDCIETEKVLEDYLKPLMEKEVDTLILGCTHYPLLTELIKQIMPDVNIISSSDSVAKEVYNTLGEKEPEDDKPGDRQFFASSDKERFIEVGRLFMDLPDNISLTK